VVRGLVCHRISFVTSFVFPPSIGGESCSLLDVKLPVVLVHLCNGSGRAATRTYHESLEIRDG
jgi:hypothetical protein